MEQRNCKREEKNQQKHENTRSFDKWSKEKVKEMKRMIDRLKARNFDKKQKKSFYSLKQCNRHKTQKQQY